MSERTNINWWVQTAPFGSGAAWITKRPSDVADPDVQYALASVARDLAHALGTATLSSSSDAGALVRQYFEGVAPQRTRAERHIRHVIEQLSLLGAVPNSATVQALNDWIAAWAAHTPTPGTSPLSSTGGTASTAASSPTSSTSSWSVVLSTIRSSAVVREGLALAPIPQKTAAALRETQSDILRGSAQLAKSQAADLNTLATLLATQNTTLLQQVTDANHNVQSIRAGLDAVARAAGATALSAANIEHASAADAFVSGVAAAVASRRGEHQAAKELLAAVKEVASTINDVAVLPRIMGSGDLPRPFNGSSISHASIAMRTEVATWEQEMISDLDAFKTARGALEGGLRALGAGLAAPLPAEFNIGTVRATLIAAARQQRTSRDDMGKVIDSAVLLVADTTSALGFPGRFRRDQAARAVHFVQEALARIDEDVRDSFLAVHGLVSGIDKIVDSFGLQPDDKASLMQLMGEINQYLQDAPTEDAATLAARAVSERSSAVAPHETRQLLMDGVRKWLAQQRDTSGSVYKAQQAVAALRMLLAQTAMQRRDGARRLEELEKLSVDVMREGMALFGPQARFVGEAAANSGQQVIAMDTARADPVIMDRVAVIKGALGGIVALQVALLDSKTVFQFNGPVKLVAPDSSTTVVAEDNTARAVADYLIRRAVDEAKSTSDVLSQVRATLAAANTTRRDGMRRIEDLEELSIDVMREGMALFGPQAIFVRAAAANSENQVTTAAAADADASVTSRFAVIKGAAAGINSLRSTLLPSPPAHQAAALSSTTTLPAGPARLKDVAFDAPENTRAPTVAKYFINTAASAAEATTSDLSQVRAALAAANATRRDGMRRIEELEKLSVDVMREGMALFGLQTPFGRESVAGATGQVVAMNTTSADPLFAKRINDIRAVSKALSVLQESLLPSVIDVQFVGPADVNNQHTNAIAAKGDTARAAADYLIKRAAVDAKRASDALADVRSALTVADATRRVGAQRLDELQRDLHATVVQFVSSLGVNIRSTTQADQLAEGVTSAIEQWKVARARENSEIVDTLDAASRAYANFGLSDTAIDPTLTGDTTFTVSTLVEYVKAAVSAIAVPTSDFENPIRAMKVLLGVATPAANIALDTIKSNTARLKKQVANLRDEIDTIDLDKLRRLDEERADALDKAYDVAVSTFITSFIASMSGISLPLLNALELIFDTNVNGAWNVMPTGVGGYVYINPQAPVPSMFRDFEKTKAISDIKPFLDYIARSGPDAIATLASSLKALVLRVLDFYTKWWFNPAANGAQLTHSLRTLMIGAPTPMSELETYILDITQQLNAAMVAEYGGMLWAYMAMRVTIGVLLSTPAFLLDARKSQYHYDPTANTTVAMLLTRQMAQAVRHRLDIGAQRDSMEHDLEVVRKEAGAQPTASFAAPENVTANATEISSVISRGGGQRNENVFSEQFQRSFPPKPAAAELDDEATSFRVVSPDANTSTPPPPPPLCDGASSDAGQCDTRLYFSDSAF